MPQTITFNGVTYSVPNVHNPYGVSLTAYLVAIPAGAFQKTGGLFTLTADADFGSTFGLKSKYFSSRTANAAHSGVNRYANNEAGPTWRNALNNADLALSVDGSNTLLFNGSPIGGGGGSGTVNPGIFNQLAYYAASTNAVSGLTLITGNKALQSDVNGLPVASSTTDTELGFVSGVTSAIQTQLNAKKTIATGNAYKFETTDTSGNLQETTVTANRAVATDANGLPVASATTDTELGFVSGVTSSIQTQINSLSGIHAKVILTSGQTYTGLHTVPWDATEFDNGSFWSGGNPTRLTIATTGIYRVTIAYRFSANATLTTQIFKNGGAVIHETFEGNAGTNNTFLTVYVGSLTASDYVELNANVTTLGTLGPNYTFAVIEKIG